MTPRARTASALALLVSSVASASAQQTAVAFQPAPARSVPEEAYLSVRFPGIVDVVVTALYQNGVVYLPAGEILGRLEITHQIDASQGILSAAWGEPTRSFRVDVGERLAYVPSGPRPLAALDLITRSEEIYLRPELWGELFGITADLDFAELSVILRSTEPPPIARRLSRETRRVRATPRLLLPPEPLRFGRDRHLLGGGMLQYALSGRFAESGSPVLVYNFSGGSELLGGDLQAGVYGTYGNGDHQPSLIKPRWRYVLDEDRRLVTQAILGTLPGGVSGQQFTGLRLTNEPVNPRATFGSHVITGRTEAGWDVELYLDGELVDYAPVDPTGRFEFRTPTRYGGSSVTLLYHGPGGELVREQRQLYVPFAFVPAGRLDYTIDAGRLVDRPESLLHGELRYGLTHWITNSLGVEQVGAFDQRPLVYDALSIRLFDAHSVGLELAPGAYFRGTFRAIFPSSAQFDVSYTRNGESWIDRSRGEPQELHSRAYLPVRLGGTSLNLHLRGRAYSDDRREWSYDIASDLLVSLGRLRASLGYGASEYGTALSSGEDPKNRVEAGAFYAWDHSTGLAPLRGLLMSGRIGAAHDGRIRDLSLDLARGVTRTTWISLSARHDAITGTNRIELRSEINLPSSRWTTTLARQTSESSFAQSIRGAVGRDPYTGGPSLSTEEMVGRAGAAFRFFLDEDGDGLFDAGERLVQGGNVEFRESIASRRTAAGHIRVDNLLPYHRYSATIDPSGITHPLWTPSLRSFSLITDPNQYKRIDIPVYPGGIIEGKVLHLQPDGSTEPVSGLTIRVRSLDGGYEGEAPIFGDGTFYMMAIPPGRYGLAIDPAQLGSLGLVHPAEQEIQIRATDDGDLVDGIVLVVVKAAEIP